MQPQTAEPPKRGLRGTDRTKDNDRFVHLLKSQIDQFALSLASSDTKNYIQQLVIEPFLQYILQRSFPYMIIAICVFSGILIIVILIFVLLLLNRSKPNVCTFCAKSF
jgi:hypothetical protein